jgi:hypothetical protein
MHQETWSKAEKACARHAFDQAYACEMQALKNALQERVQVLDTPEDIWELHDFLSQKRQEIDEKYDYRYSQLIVVFARLISEGVLEEEKLSRLAPEKRLAIHRLVHGWDELSA